MILQTVRLNQFRNYESLKHEFSLGLNIFLGKNGEGKTNLLESVYYLSHFSSFRTHQTEILSRDKNKQFSIQLSFQDGKTARSVGVIHQQNKRELKLDGESIQKLTKAKGQLKVILFTVRDIDLILLSPSVRRSFIDDTLCLMKSEYAELMVNYEKLIKLRNQQLKKGRNTGSHQNWDDMLVSYGTKIIYARNSFLKAIIPLFQSIFSQFTDKKIPINILYRLGNGSKSDVVSPREFKMTEDYYRRWLEETKQDDMRTGFTHFGPHADDYLFQMRHDLLKNNASQGEMRLFIYTFKLAIYEYFKKVIKKTPVIILDDVFNDFDEERIQNFFNYLKQQEQVIISCANQNLILPYLPSGLLKKSVYRIHQGKIYRYDHTT